MLTRGRDAWQRDQPGTALGSGMMAEGPEARVAGKE